MIRKLGATTMIHHRKRDLHGNTYVDVGAGVLGRANEGE